MESPSSPVRRASGPAPDAADVEHCMRVVESEFHYVYRLLRRWGMNHADAEDVAQEVFLVMWRRRREWDRERSLRPWLAEVAFRLALAQRRRHRREVPSEQIDAEDTKLDLDDQIGLAQARGMFLQILARLSAKQRAVFVLHELDELPIRDVAERLGLPLFTTYSRLRAARAAFAKELRRLQLVNSVRRRPARVRALMIGAAAIVLAALMALWWPHLRGERVLGGVGPSRSRGGGAQGSPALAEGVVAYWSLDESTGRDRSPQGNHCLPHRPDAIAPIDGVLAGAVTLSGGWLECARTASFDRLSGPLSISAWVLRSQPQRNLRTIVARQRGDGPDDDFYLGLSELGVVFSSTGWPQLVARTELPSGRWFHLAALRRPDGQVSVYLNGSLLGTRTAPAEARGPVEAHPILIGAATNGPDPTRVTQQLHGGLDEVILYDRVLSPGDIAALAGGARPVF
jgi:RNA polymerase sigma-70 factor (ECF subfamily)